MQAGKLNERVLLQCPEITQDDFGALLKKWVDVGEVWANVRFQRGAEFQRGNADLRTVSVSVRVRFRRDLDADMRLIHRGRIFAITAVLPDETGKQYVDLVCIEQRGDGES